MVDIESNDGSLQVLDLGGLQVSGTRDVVVIDESHDTVPLPRRLAPAFRLENVM